MIKETPIYQFGNVDEGATTEFQVEVTSKLFEMLSGLYSNKIRAVIRELLCNAIDSHISAKVSEPVRIIRPNSSYPYLVIQDFGTGMSPETVNNVYTRYSCSTKMHDKDTTGALGLGSKSPFCYTNMFTMATIFNGVKYTYNLYLNSKRVPSITLLKTENVDDENGTTITVPVKSDHSDYREFNTQLAYVLSHTTFPVSVYSKTVSSSDEEGIPVEYDTQDETTNYSLFQDIYGDHEDGSMIVTDCDMWKSSATGCYVLQANVIYPIQSSEMVHKLYTAALRERTTCIFKVPNGSISFSPTREELSLDNDTVEYIAQMVDRNIAKYKTWARYLATFQKKDIKLQRHIVEKVKDQPALKFLFNYSRVVEFEKQRDTSSRDGRWVAERRKTKDDHGYTNYRRFPFPAHLELDTVRDIGTTRNNITEMNFSHDKPLVIIRRDKSDRRISTSDLSRRLKKLYPSLTSGMNPIIVFASDDQYVKRVLRLTSRRANIQSIRVATIYYQDILDVKMDKLAANYGGAKFYIAEFLLLRSKTIHGIEVNCPTFTIKEVSKDIDVPLTHYMLRVNKNIIKEPYNPDDMESYTHVSFEHFEIRMGDIAERVCVFDNNHFDNNDVMVGIFTPTQYKRYVKEYGELTHLMDIDKRQTDQIPKDVQLFLVYGRLGHDDCLSLSRRIRAIANSPIFRDNQELSKISRRLAIELEYIGRRHQAIEDQEYGYSKYTKSFNLNKMSGSSSKRYLTKSSVLADYLERTDLSTLGETKVGFDVIEVDGKCVATLSKFNDASCLTSNKLWLRYVKYITSELYTQYNIDEIGAELLSPVLSRLYMELASTDESTVKNAYKRLEAFLTRLKA